MRNIQRLLALLLLLAPAVFLHAETVKSLGKPTGYVDDYAGILSPDTKSQMEATCAELHEKTKAQIFVVTINTLGDETIEHFANDLFHTWKIGEKKTDRGVLLIFAIKEHKYRYEVGYGLEGVLNDAKVGDFGRAIVPDLRSGNLDAAAKLGLHEVAQVIADDAKVQLSSVANEAANDTPPPSGDPVATVVQQKQDEGSGWLTFALFVAFWLAIVIFILRSSRKRGTGSGGSSWSSSSSNDSSSSGSDFSSSSSSDFSGGDGGDSGGGGASGDW